MSVFFPVTISDILPNPSFRFNRPPPPHRLCLFSIQQLPPPLSQHVEFFKFVESALAHRSQGMQFTPGIRQPSLPFVNSFSVAKKHAIYGYTICFDSVISIILSHTRAGCSSSFDILRVFLRLFQMCVMLPMCSCVSVVLLHIKLPGSKLCWLLPCAFERSIAWILSVHAATKSECIDAHKARMLSRRIPMLATHF